MISVCTSTYNNTPEQLARAWASLKAQTYTNWVWNIYDDSTDPTVWANLYGLCADERYKIDLYRPHVPSRGNIGLSKHNCFMLAKGDILVELDADDVLTPDALQLVSDTFDRGAGFAYSDWCEILPDGQSGKYPDGWAFGFGDHYWDTEHSVWAMKAPPINEITIRHIVSAPNHLRAWDSDLYRKIGGHDITLPVADDFDLVVRTFLEAELTHIPKMLYIQYVGSHTAQRQRNDLIQTLVADLAEKYRDRITARFNPENGKGSKYQKATGPPRQ